MMKKLLSLVLVLCLLATLPLTAMAEKKDFVLFTPWSNTSTPEDMKMVRTALEEATADIGLSLDWIIVPIDGALEKLNVTLTDKEPPGRCDHEHR